jgi:hypothetical protein
VSYRYFTRDPLQFMAGWDPQRQVYFASVVSEAGTDRERVVWHSLDPNCNPAGPDFPIDAIVELVSSFRVKAPAGFYRDLITDRVEAAPERLVAIYSRETDPALN